MLSSVPKPQAKRQLVFMERQWRRLAPDPAPLFPTGQDAPTPTLTNAQLHCPHGVFDVGRAVAERQQGESYLIRVQSQPAKGKPKDFENTTQVCQFAADIEVPIRKAGKKVVSGKATRHFVASLRDYKRVESSEPVSGGY